jgi:hypothetical protein
MIDPMLKRDMDGEPGLDELHSTLRELSVGAGRVLSARKLKKGVYRVTIARPTGRLSLIAKRLTPPVAYRNQLALERWLPTAGLEHAAPTLVGVAAERTGRAVWHLYDDLGDVTLEDPIVNAGALPAAVELIATLHASFAAQPVLAECRLWERSTGLPSTTRASATQ